MSKPAKKVWNGGKKVLHEANPENWGVTKKMGHEIDKHVFNGQWTKGWRQGLETAAIVAATIYTGGAAAGAWGYGAGAAGATGAVGAGAAATGYGAAALAGGAAVAGTAAIGGGLAGLYMGKQSHDTIKAQRAQAAAEAEANAAAAEADRIAKAERSAELKKMRKQIIPTTRGMTGYAGGSDDENYAGLLLG